MTNEENADKCIMCEKTINLWHHTTYEYDHEGEVWCDECFQKESDIGE